jgi:uncharacterized linocin/CFP29 family protein
MPDWLRRSLAPLTEEAWEEVDSTAARVLKDRLSARTLVDFDGPHGSTLGAVNLGRLEIPKKKAPGNVPWGIRKVMPLIEARIPFVLLQMELDNVTRGCKDPDLSPLEEAARNLALFEETAIYKGFAEGHVRGIIEAAAHEAVAVKTNAEDLPKAVASGVEALKSAGVGGPYALALGGKLYYPLMQAGKGGYPPSRIIRTLLDGEILWSPALDDGLLLSKRGGDFELTVGDDISIGYASHDRDKVELYLLESFAFRVLEPAAAVALEAS